MRRSRTPRAIVIAVAITLVASPAGASVGQTVVRPWRGSAKAAVSFTMDDGYASQARLVAPLLSSRGFAGTFFVVTQWLDQEDLWPRWVEVAGAGHEIGSHGLTHAQLDRLDSRSLREELESSLRRIQEKLGTDQGRSFAYPYSVGSPELARAVQAASYDAARTGGDATNPAAPDLYRVQARHPLSHTPLGEMNGWVDEVILSGGWLVIGVHGILDPLQPAPPSQEGWEPVPLERYVGLVDHLAAAGGALWVAPFGDVARYVRAREAATAKLEEATAERIRVAVQGPPGGPGLTLETEVPADWVEVSVQSDGAPPTLQPTALANGVRLVRYPVVPPAAAVLSPAALARPAREP